MKITRLPVMARALATLVVVLFTASSNVVTASGADDPNDSRVQALAATLGNNPATIFQHVRDNIGIEIYNGSLRGARGTLASKAGNSLDRASLTIALLRAANPSIEARYAQGTLGNTEATAIAARMFNDPSRVLGCDNPAPAFTGGFLSLVSEATNHFWVEYRMGSSGPYTALDTALTTTAANQTLASATQTFTSIPSNLRHTTRIRLEVESFTQAAAAFGLALGTTTVLDQTFDSVDLVDRAVSVSHFANSFSPPSLTVGATQNTYSPYLTVGDSTTSISNYNLIRGIDYNEIVTNFPLGNILVTGVFVTVDVTDAAAQTQSQRRPMFDRIGYVTRTQGGPVTVDQNSLTRPVLTELDVMTLAISPSRQALDDFSARKARLQELQAQVALLQPLVQALPPPGQRDATQEAVARDSLVAARYSLIANNELALASFLGAADQQIDEQSLRSLVKAYIASPRITIAMSRFKNDALALSLDLRKNDLRVFPLPGIAMANARNFERNRGLGESILEGEVLSSITGDPNRSISSVLATVTDASRYRPVTNSNLSVIDSLNLSTESKLRIRAAVQAGRVVLAPMDVVTVGGVAVNAWLETDPSTGYTISTLEDGSHGAFVEYVFAVAAQISSSQAAVMGQLIGRVNAVGVFGIALTAAIVDSIVAQRPFSDLGQQLRTTLAPILKGIVQSIKAELDLMGLLAIEIEGPAGIVKELLTGLIEGLDDMTKMFAGENGDPPLPRLLFSSATPPVPAAQTPGATAGLALSATLDARFSRPFAGAEFASVYLMRAVNTGPNADTFRFTASGGGGGLNVTDPQYVLPIVRIKPGATFEFHLCIDPNSAIPAAGAVASFQVTGTSTTTPSVTTTTMGAFTTPSTPALRMRFAPSPQAALPGDSVPVTLTLDSLGNQATSVALTTQSSPGLVLTGVPSTALLAVGESRSIALTAIVGDGVSPGTALEAVVHGSFGGAFPVRATASVTVTSAITHCAAPASVAATQIGRANLAGLLGVLSTDIDQLATQPQSISLRDSVLREIDGLVAQFNAPFLSALAPGFASARGGIASANVGTMGSALSALDAQFCALQSALRAAYTDAYRVYLSPAIATALPNLTTRVNLNLFNDTANPRAMNLAVVGLPAGVTATFNTTRVVVPANYRTNFYLPESYVTFSNDGTAQSFEYQIVVTPEDDSSSAKTTLGHFSVRPEIVRVVDVNVSPAYGDAGTIFTPTVKLLSAVNDTREVKLRYVVKNRNGQAVTFPSPIAAVTVTSGDNVQSITMSPFSAIGFPDGPYTVEVTAYDAVLEPIPGAVGMATVFVGQPFAAGLTVTPALLAPGTSTVNVALNLEHSLVAQQSLKLRSTLALPAGPLSFAQNGDYLYVCQNTAVTIVNVSNPDTPVTTGTFASAVLTNGAPSGFETVDCTVYNGQLIVGFDKKLPERSGSRTLAIFDIAGANATSPLLLTPTPIDTGKKFGSGLRFIGTDGYMSTGLFVYNPFSNFIFEQHGNLLKFDFSTPFSPTLTGSLYPSGAGNPPENQSDTGGPHFVTGVAAHTNTRALVATTTGTGDFFNGVGNLLTVDTSQLPTNCPGLSNPCIVSTLTVPQAHLLIGVASQGAAAIATGDTQGFYDVNSGYTGNLTLSAINLTNPSAPTLSSTLVTPLVHNETYTCNQAERKGFSSTQALTNNYYAIGAYNPASCTWVLVLIDANDPGNLRFIPYDVPDSIRGFVLNGNLLYAITASSVLVFDYTGIVGPSVTANVVVPKGTGVTIVPNSFNVTPTFIASTATSDTYTWQQPVVAPITWQAIVSAMQPGTGREVATGGDVQFTLPTLGSGRLPLSPAIVTSNHIIAVSTSVPLLVAIGSPATYVVTLTNPSLTSPVTYNLTTEGVPVSWVKTLAPSITLGAGAVVTTPLIVQSNIGQSGGSIDFRVVSNANGISDAAVATLGNYYGPNVGEDTTANVGASIYTVTPTSATGAKGSTTSITVTVTNTGTVTDEYSMTDSSLPNNSWSTTIEPTSAWVGPGESIDFKISVAVPTSPNVAMGNNSATFALYSRAVAPRLVSTNINVLDAGVALTMSPNSGTTVTPFTATITNLSGAADTFDLALTGPLGPTITPSASTVALAAGASTTVNLSVGSAAAFARPGTSSFGVLAVSRAAPSAFARASAVVTIPIASAVNVTGQPATSVLTSTPTTRVVNVVIQNLGNIEDQFSLTILGTSGPVTAQLLDASGAAVSSITGITIPAFSSAVARLSAMISSNSAATVTVRATSMSTATTQANATIQFGFVAPPVCSLDVDADGKVNALTDGLLVIRYMLGLSGSALTNGIYASGGGAEFGGIVTRLGVIGANNWLDVDGNGEVKAESDGILLLRALFGLNGTAVTENALGISPRSRETWPTIRDYLNTVCGLGLP